MDLPQAFHHHSHNPSRYVSVSNSSRFHNPEDHPNFPNPRQPENPRYQQRSQFHHHVHHNPLPPPPPQTPPFQPPPPPPPPPHPSSSHPLPFRSPPSHIYNTGQSQITFPNPSHDRPFDDGERSTRSSIVRRSFSPSPKVLQHHRMVVEGNGNDRRRHQHSRAPEFSQEVRSESWDQPRVLAENLKVRSLDYDTGVVVPQRYQLSHNKLMPQYKTINRLRHDPESGSSRFRVEYEEALEKKQGVEVLRGPGPEGYYRRANLVSSSGVSIREVEFVPNQRNLVPKSEIYEGRYEEELFRSGRGDREYENQRRVYDRKLHREVGTRGSAEIGNGDETRFVPVKREYPGQDSGRYSSRGGSRGESYSYQEVNNRTPRKQFVKKSALLRIQNPGYSNAENEKMGYYGYQRNSDSSPYRRRVQYAHTGSNVEEEEELEGEGRERSPVLLDVSFKSNSLVAKAIVVTPPSAADDTDANLTPRDMEGTERLVSDTDRLDAELTRPSGSVVDVGSSAQVVNSASTFDNETIVSEEKVMSAKDVCDISLNATDTLVEKNEVRRSPTGADSKKVRVGASKRPLKVVSKKKKVVKKVIKKVPRPRSRVLSSGRKKHLEDEPVTADFCVPTPSVDPGTHKDKGVGTREKVEEEPQMAREIEEQGTDHNSSTFVNVENNGNILSTHVESSTQEEGTTDNVPVYAPNPSLGLNTVSDSNKDLTSSHSMNIFPNVAHAVDLIQSHQIGDSMSVVTGDNRDYAVSDSGHTKVHDNLTSVFYPANTTADTTLDTSDGTKSSKEDSLVREEIPKGTSRSKSVVDCSSSMETTTDVHGSHREENIIFSASIDDCTIKEQCADGASGLPEIDTAEISLDTSVSVGGNEEDTSTICKKRDRSQLDFSRETNDNLDATNVSDPATATKIALSLSSQNPISEVAVSSLGGIGDCQQPGRDRVNVPHDSSSCDITEANLICRDADNSASYVTSLQCKRRKVTSSDLNQQNDEINEDTSSFCMELPSTSIDVGVQQQSEFAKSTTRKLDEGSSDGVMSFLNDEQKKEDGVDVVATVTMQSRREGEGEGEGEGEEEEEEMGVSVLGEHDGPSPFAIPSDIQLPNVDETFSITGTRESDILLEKCDFPSFSNDLSPQTDCNEATSVDEAMEFAPDSLALTHTLPGSPQTLLNVSDIHMLDATSVSQISSEICMDDKNLDQSKSVNDSGLDVCAQKLFPHCSESSVLSVEPDASSLALQDSRGTSQGLSVTDFESSGQKKQHGHIISRTFPGRSSSRPASTKKRGALTKANARTWHRNASSSAASLPRSNPLPQTVPSQRQLQSRDVKFQSTSYVRKGNSLVRNPSPPIPLSQGSGFSTVYRLNSAGLDESKRSVESENRLVVGNLQSVKMLPSSTSMKFGDFTSSTSAGPLASGCDGSNSDAVNSSENNDPKLIEDLPTSEDFENKKGQLSNSDNQSELNEGNSSSLNAKRIVYIKRKSNQLVASSNSGDLPVVNAGKASSFNGYYKRRKNQLIRTSLENHTRKPFFLSNRSLNAASSLRFNKRRSFKAIPKKCSTNSLVWTLCSANSSKNGNSLNQQKVFPHLFPWKRTSYWRNFRQNWSLFPNSSSPVARKLMLSRQRDTVYTKSINGFSLRKSKVLSVGGSSLKWSKSIERDSKKANEEATLAVAAVERKKREQKCIASGPKNRNHSSRERIFRIGLFRYKMDPSRRTLQRISDDESSSCAPSTNPVKDAKRFYIPRRLVIGTNEYVRIGNGNQLVRDPKKRARVLASEKVRWSLHTARLRLARKKKYCQFFTRFGRCNKDSGKCPYLHDPSKIAVCTKFLNGLCTDANCNLTHKVIPERMPDCSYFLQGLCTNQSCPYRHVNVNPKAPTCEGFLRGYCAEGDECRKKHSYVCPAFEATGTCPQGSKCKLHHPKNRVNGKKRKRSNELKNGRGRRYFGSPDISILESRSVVSEKCSALDNTVDLFSQGTCADYIAIGSSVDDAEENNAPMSAQTMFCDSDTSSDLESEDLDELIKPIRLMVTTSSTA